MKVFVSAGEVSGDMAGARLVERLRRKAPDLQLYGVGGWRLARAGVALDFATNHLGTVGVSEAVAILPALRRAFAAIRRRVRQDPPEVAILIANDVFNVLLGRWLRARGIPTVAYFPPQVWIWGSLARAIVPSFDLILTCFAAEQQVYERAAAGRSTTVTFVGHYLAETLKPRTTAEIAAARAKYGVPERSRVIGLLPGSRVFELESHLPALLRAGGELATKLPAPVFLLPVAEDGLRERVERELRRWPSKSSVTLVDSSHDVMRAADLLVLASGTASLEAALLGVPMVIVYKVRRMTMLAVRLAIAAGLIDSDTVGLPNLILGARAFPELKQSRATVGLIVSEAASILDQPERREGMRAACAEVARRVAVSDSLDRAADAILELAEARTRGASAIPPGDLTFRPVGPKEEGG
ncbi:MAG: lipid-A-disaccharide synthase [Acidobacteriota bacterium]